MTPDLTLPLLTLALVGLALALVGLSAGLVWRERKRGPSDEPVTFPFSQRDPAPMTNSHSDPVLTILNAAERSLNAGSMRASHHLAIDAIRLLALRIPPPAAVARPPSGTIDNPGNLSGETTEIIAPGAPAKSGTGGRSSERTSPAKASSERTVAATQAAPPKTNGSVRRASEAPDQLRPGTLLRDNNIHRPERVLAVLDKTPTHARLVVPGTDMVRAEIILKDIFIDGSKPNYGWSLATATAAAPASGSGADMRGG